MSPAKSTPMIKQYLSIKEQYPDTILFYRMGDFYEMFFEDAQLASRILEITLTSRNKNDESPIPMCGVPHHAAKSYIARLIDNGYKVAVCDQIEDAAAAKGLVKRDVVRVITPGMVIENELLDERANNFVLSLFCRGDFNGIAYLDISTGAFRVSESKDAAAIVDEVRRISPSELLLPQSAKDDPAYLPVKGMLPEVATSYLDNRAFEYKRSYERLTDQFKTITLEGFGCEALQAGICAAGAAIYYVSETQKQKLAHLSRIETYWLDRYLIVDAQSRQNLELSRNIRTGSRQATLLGILDRTATAMGARLLANWMRYPLLEPDEIRARLDAVEEVKKNLQVRRSVRENLKSVNDIERIGSKIVMGHANARDLVALKRSLRMLPAMWNLLSELKAKLFVPPEKLGELNKLADLIDRSIREDAPPTINEGGIIKPGYNRELDELVQISRDGKGWLAQLEIREKEASGINALKVRYNKVFGYYIEVPKSRSASVPAHYVRKQTLVNAERYITDELKTFEMKVFGAEDRRAVLEYDLFNEIRDQVAGHNPCLQRVARFLARIDCLVNLAGIADQNDYCRPAVTADGCIAIEDGRHPVVEKMITAERFVPNSIKLDNQSNQILIITGPNMAGKSTVLRQVALMVVMAQMGSFIPAASATISITDRIFTRVGALDNLSSGQSTFMVEMEETANILNNATDKSLVIMDEIGRGTSTFDGLSIAWAVAEYLHELDGRGVKTLFATHYHELTDLARMKPRVKNFNIAVKEWNDEIIFLRKLVEGGTNRSYGIQVARLAGIPERVIKRAKRILYHIEQGEYGGGGPACLGNVTENVGRRPVQLDLFSKPGHPVVEKLNQVDISRLTPLEALNLLNELQEQTKK
ncbi:MAG: DNA mismatch repair protein MutS [Deltaproteobacteria bacterium]|jgi:DNA mismatch repair protein MutS|nr:DNA mismatch repair protein MutS [Deltaproteobacteria bacterium]